MVKEGYKETEIGVIPEDWRFSHAKELMNIKTGSKNTEHKSNDGRYPLFVRSQQVEHIDNYSYDCEAVLTAGDGVGTGKVFHYINGKFDAHQRVYVMSQFKGIYGKFFYYYFKENFGYEVLKYTAKSSVDSVRKDMITEMLIPIPLMEEQQKIAEALSDMDNLISALEKLIEKKKAIKQACLQKMFPKEGESVPEMRLPGFTDAWERRKLGDIASDMVAGGDIDKDLILAEGQYPVIANALTGDGIVGYYDKEYRVNAPAVTVTGRGDVGHAKARLVNFTPVVRLLSVKSEHDVFFLENAINTLKIVIESTGVPQLTVPQLAKYEVAFPRQLDEEEHIGAFFKQLDNLITLHQCKLEKCKKIKEGMMQQLLTGKIRLI